MHSLIIYYDFEEFLIVREDSFSWLNHILHDCNSHLSQTWNITIDKMRVNFPNTFFTNKYTTVCIEGDLFNL